MDGELYSKLTSSGKAGLRQVRENFTDSVLERAYRIAVKHNTGDSEISLRDIMDAKNEILYNRSLYRYRRLFTISFFLLTVGVVYLVIGYYSLYFKEGLRFDLSDDGFLISLLGIVASVIALLFTFLAFYKEASFSRFIKDEKIFSVNDIDTLLMQWQRIEMLGRNIYNESENVEDGDTPTIGIIHKKIAERLPDEYKVKMRDILNLRNDYLHRGARHSSEEINKAISDANEIIDILVGDQVIDK